MGGSLRVSVIAYLDILKAWQQIKLEGDVDKVLDNDLAMLGHSTVIKEQREAVQSKLNSSYRASWASIKAIFYCSTVRFNDCKAAF